MKCLPCFVTVMLMLGSGIAAAESVGPAARGELPAHPLTLQQAIDLAIQRNPDMHVAQARIETARARMQEIQAAFFPHLQAGLGYTASNDPSRAFGMIVAQRRFDFSMDINEPGYIKDFRPEIGASWSLFRGGQDYFSRQAAKLGLDVQKARKNAVHGTLRAAVSSAFYALLEAPQQIEVARRTLTAVGKELEHVRSRREQGMALKSDVLSLEVRLNQAEAAEIRAHNAEEAARTALRALLAAPADSSLKTNPTDVAEPLAAPGEFSDWLDQARRHRPELQAAEKNVAAKEKALLAARGARLPRVDAFAVYGQNSKKPQFSTDKDNVTVGVRAEIDLFSGGAITARIEQAQRQLEEARALNQKIHLQVEREVKQAWLTLREALAQLNVARAEVAAAEEALRLVREQYRGGTATVTRYLNAETDAASAQLHSISARFNALSAQAEMQRATGMGIAREPSS